MSIGFSGSFSALGATIGSKGAAAGAGGCADEGRGKGRKRPYDRGS